MERGEENVGRKTVRMGVVVRSTTPHRKSRVGKWLKGAIRGNVGVDVGLSGACKVWRKFIRNLECTVVNRCCEFLAVRVGD